MLGSIRTSPIPVRRGGPSEADGFAPWPFALPHILDFAFPDTTTNMEADRPVSWIDALISTNEGIVACERRLHRQCIVVARLAGNGQVTAEDEMLLASYMTSLGLVRAHRANPLADASGVG